jgi:hypothetical protein
MAIGLKIVNGDFVLDNSGQVQMLNVAEKCRRDIGKFLITESEYANNETTYYRYNPQYGTEINNKILYEGLPRSAIRDTVVTKLNEALRYYVTNQETRNNLDLEEILTGFDFDVFFDSFDPTKLLIDIRFQTLTADEETLGQFEQRVV